MILNSTDRRQIPTRLLYIAPVIILVAAIFLQSLVDWFIECAKVPWNSQGLVVVPFALAIGWMRWRSAKSLQARYEPRGMVLIAVGCAIHLLGLLGATSIVSQLSFVIVVAGVIWAFWGTDHLRLSALPLLLLTTAIPLPSFVYTNLSLPLQLLVSRSAFWIAEIAGVAVHREGNIIHLATITLGVAEACGGLKSLSSLIVGAILLGAMLCRLPRTRVILGLATIPVAIVTNIARVAGTVILSDWSPEYAMGFYHAFSGWLVFLVGFACLYGVAIGLRTVLEK